MKGKTVIKIVLAVLLIAALGFLISAIYHYTNGFNEDFKTMYLERDGEKILASVNTAHFDCGEKVTYSVKYTFPSGKDETRDFTATVTPNAEANFEFQTDGITRIWKTQDLTKIFAIKKEAGSFTLTVPSPCRISDVVKKLYPNAKEIAFPEEDFDREQNFYTLTVTSYNKSVTYTVNFSACEAIHPFTVTHEVKEVNGKALPEDGYKISLQYIDAVNSGRSARYTLGITNELIQPLRLEWRGADGSSGTVLPTSPSKPISPLTYYFTLPLETDCECVIYLNYNFG